MAYSTLDDLLQEIDESVLIELTDDADNPVGEIDLVKIASAIQRADGIIDGHLCRQMTVPLSVVPDIIRTSSVDLALYTIFTRREALPERREQRYKLALSFLTRISNGELIVSGAIGSTDSWPSTYSPDADFSSEVWAVY